MTDYVNRTCRAVKNACDTPVDVRPDLALVADLGFDSLRMATLALALEDEFGSTLLLNEWIARAEDPERLTVASLADFVERQLARKGPKR